MAIGVVWAFFVRPETKGVPLDELAAIFGDDDEIVVYMKDIHIDHTTHQLVVDHRRGTVEIGRVVTELHGRPKPTDGEVEGSPVEQHSPSPLQQKVSDSKSELRHNKMDG
jgi:hypothetical protein